MGKTDYLNGGFVACIPQQIEAHWDGEWGPRVAGFPLNIVYLFVQKSKVDGSEIWGAITACYEPDLATFRETKKTREMTYFSPGRRHLPRACGLGQGRRPAGNLQIQGQETARVCQRAGF